MTHAGFHRIFIPGRLNRSSLANLCCKRPPGEISVQNIPHGPVYPAGFAGYITLGIAITTAIGIAIAWKIAPALDRLSLGDATAFHLGVDVARIRLVALIALSILAGGAVSTVGSIAFIGLAAPHIARFIYGPAHRNLIAHSAIIGALIVVVADTVSRTIAQPNELPIGLATALLGAPVLIALVAFNNNVWRTQ